MQRVERSLDGLRVEGGRRRPELVVRQVGELTWRKAVVLDVEPPDERMDSRPGRVRVGVLRPVVAVVVGDALLFRGAGLARAEALWTVVVGVGRIRRRAW